MQIESVNTKITSMYSLWGICLCCRWYGSYVV